MLHASQENTAPILEPSVLLPSQVADGSSRRILPELRLAAAVLEDAITCLGRGADARGRHHRDFFDTRRWLWDDDRSWPFAFYNVCELLALDPMAVRMQLEGLCGDGPARRRVSTWKAARSSCRPGT